MLVSAERRLVLVMRVGMCDVAITKDVNRKLDELHRRWNHRQCNDQSQDADAHVRITTVAADRSTVNSGRRA